MVTNVGITNDRYRPIFVKGVTNDLQPRIHRYHRYLNVYDSNGDSGLWKQQLALMDGVLDLTTPCIDNRMCCSRYSFI